MSLWVNRIYTLSQRTSAKFVELTEAGYFEDIETDIKNNTNFTGIHTDELRTSLWVMTEDFKEDCKNAVKIITKYYKKYLQNK